MIRRATLDDKGFVQKLYAIPGMVKYLTDDNCPDFITDDLDAIISAPTIYPLISSIDGTDTGLYMFFPWNYTTYELHVSVLPEYRGQHSIDAGIESGKWMFRNTVCHKIITQIPTPNYKAKALALAVGMTQEGVNRKSYMKDGKLYDMYWYGILKEEVAL